MLTGPELAPHSGVNPKYLTIFLHGVGADGQDLLSLATEMGQHFPDMHFISPNAPFPFENAYFGYQWFSLKDTSTSSLAQGLNEAMPHLNKFIDHQLKRFNLDESKLIVIGFSQGTMIALHTLLRRPKPVALIIGLSGTLVDDGSLATEIQSRPDVLLMHGDKDQIIPLNYLKVTYSKLTALGLVVGKKIYPKMSHSIIPTEISDIIASIKAKLHSQIKNS